MSAIMKDARGQGVSALLGRFDAAWAATRKRFGKPPDLAQFLPAQLDSSAREALFIQLVKKDLRQRIAYQSLLIDLDETEALQGWEAGLDPWLARYPELRRNDRGLRSLILEEFQARRTFDPQVKADEVQRRFPEVWDEDLAHSLAELKLPRRSYVIFPWKIGEGTFGEVYWAYNRVLRRWEAAKKIKAVYRGYREFGQRLVQEARIAGRLDHPGIAPVHALTKDDSGRPYYVMRYVAGETLESRISKLFGGSFGPPDSDGFLLERQTLLRYFVDVCRTVMYAHNRRVVHRDLKPANILIRDNAAVVVDWGLAKERFAAIGDAFALGMSSDPTQSQGIVGTLCYMSPELAAMASTAAATRNDRVQPASDIYSLGATLYHILTGHPAFQGADSEQVRRQVVVSAFPKPRQTFPQIPRSLEAICLKAMSADPHHRYPSAEAMAEDIERDLAGLPVSAYTEPFSARAKRWAKKHKTGIRVAALVLVLAAAGAGVASALVKSAETSSRTGTLIANLKSVPLDEAPEIVRKLADDRQRAEIGLESAWEQTRGLQIADERRLRIAFALELLRGDGRLTSELTDIALNLPLKDALALREAAAIASPDAVSRFWKVLEDQQAPPPSRFNAACMLAHAGEDRGANAVKTATRNPGRETPRPEIAERWGKNAGFIVDQALRMASENPETFSDAELGMRPLGQSLISELVRVLAEPSEPDHRKVFAGRLLEQYSGGSAKIIAGGLLEDIPDVVRAKFEGVLKRSPDEAVARLNEELKKTASQPNSEETIRAFERLARRQATAALTLAQLGRFDAVWSLLKMTKSPTVRYEIIEYARIRALPFDRIVERLAREEDASARQALMLMLGHWRWEDVTTDQRAALEPQIQDRFRTDPDPGVHSAAEWLLKHWGRTVQRVTSPPPDLKKGQGWFVTPSGLTMIAIAGSDPFQRGFIPGESVGATDPRQWVRVDRNFAMSAMEVSGALYKQFAQERPNARIPNLSTDWSKLKDDEPALSIDWFSAAQFCRWLSEKEGFADQECPYPSIQELQQARKNPLVLPSDFLKRPGYRLPTEMEWECACRAETDSSFFLGWSDRMLRPYAHYYNQAATADGPISVGSLKPNPWGFFDILGNVHEWNQDAYQKYLTGLFIGIPLTGDPRSSARLDPTVSRVDRGGSYASVPRFLGSGARQLAPPTTNHREMGFRVVRTLP